MATNGATILGAPWDLDREPPLPREAFHRAWPAIDRARRASLADGTGHGCVVAAVGERGDVVTTTLVPESFLVIGRHTRCGLALGDVDVSLRHLVAHWSSAAPALRVWDLRTAQPFVTEDGQRTSAVVADGVTCCTVAGYTLVFVPLDAVTFAMDADDAWAHLPRRRYDAIRPAREHVARRGLDTTVTHTLPALVFGGPSGPDGPVVGELSLDLPTGRTTRRVTEAQLERGFLFGRYERCQLGAVDDGWLSRVHLLVVRIGRTIWAIDTASTNGTKHNGVPAGAFPLGDAPVRLLLGRSCVVAWRPGSPSLSAD